MDELSIADGRRNLAELVNRVAYGKERVVLTRHGKRLCALVPIDDLSVLDKLRAAATRSDVDHALSEAAENGSVAWSALRHELGLDE